jgi:hypothetical protein
MQLARLAVRAHVESDQSLEPVEPGFLIGRGGQLDPLLVGARLTGGHEEFGVPPGKLAPLRLIRWRSPD